MLIHEGNREDVCTLMNLWGQQANATKGCIQQGNSSQIDCTACRLVGLSRILEWAPIVILTAFALSFIIMQFERWVPVATFIGLANFCIDP